MHKILPLLTIVTEHQSSVCYLNYNTYHSYLIYTKPDADKKKDKQDFYLYSRRFRKRVF